MENRENMEQSGKKKSKKIVYWALIAVFATVFIICSITVLVYFFGDDGTVNHYQQMDDLRDKHQRPSGIVRPTNNITPSTTLPTDPTNPDEPTVPTDPTDPSNPTVPSDPTQPSNPIVPSDPTQPVNPTEPKPTDPQPTDPQPTEPKPTQPTVPTKPPHVELVILESMQPIYELNQDVVGWIQIPGTPNNIDYPVLQKKDDPDFYLYRDFYGEDDPHGCIYAEEHADVFGPSDVVTLHGHHMGDGTMFHDLKNFKSKNYFDSHKVIYFDTLYHYREYEVVMVFHCNGSPSKYYPYFAYHAYKNFKTEAGFNSYVDSLRELAIQGKDAELNFGDKLLLLSTCDYGTYPNGRMVVVAKLVAEY